MNKLKMVITNINDMLVSSNIFMKIIGSLLVWLVALIPVYLYLLTYWIVSPDNFWEGFVIAAIFLILIGWLQGVLLVIAIGLTICVIVS